MWFRVPQGGGAGKEMVGVVKFVGVVEIVEVVGWRGAAAPTRVLGPEPRSGFRARRSFGGNLRGRAQGL